MPFPNFKVNILLKKIALKIAIAASLKSQLDDLVLKINYKPNSLATIDEAFRVQKLVEEILSKT